MLTANDKNKIKEDLDELLDKYEMMSLNPWPEQYDILLNFIYEKVEEKEKANESYNTNQVDPEHHLAGRRADSIIVDEAQPRNSCDWGNRWGSLRCGIGLQSQP